MAAARFLAILASGLRGEVAAVVTSAGAADDGKVVGLDATGRLDNSVMPVGIGAETASVLTSEALSAGNYVQVYNNAGTPNVRKADGSTTGKFATGFVLAAFASGVQAVVYSEGLNTAVTGQLAGAVYLGTTAGAGSATGAATAGQTYQKIGDAVSATVVAFSVQEPIIRA